MPTPKAPVITAIDRGPALAHHFDNIQQQHDAAIFGMWVFLVTEIMFFGGFLTGYLIYRQGAPEAFAEASAHLDVLAGTLNTVVLLTSSLTMALAVHYGREERPRWAFYFLLATLVLGLLFLGVKFSEYYHKYEQQLMPVLGLPFAYEGPNAGQVKMFYNLYFGLTGLHATHMVIGAGLLLVLMPSAWRGRYNRDYYSPLEAMGLYWHFVDIVWIFLFPLLYLIDRAYIAH